MLKSWVHGPSRTWWPPRTKTQVAEVPRSPRGGASPVMVRTVARDFEGGFLKEFVESSFFSRVSLWAVVGNTIFIGVHTELSLQDWLSSAGGDENEFTSTLEWIEMGFCFFFTAELLLRIMADPKAFSRGESWKWNVLDTVLVTICVMDIIMKQIFRTTTGAMGSFTRILRVLRMARILRIIRVMRFFRSLRLMVYSIVHSLTPLLWVFMLLSCIMYGCAVFIMQQVFSHVKDEFDPERDRALLDNFGSVRKSITVLFMTICGGQNWGVVYDQLEDMSVMVALVFLLYIFFVIFGVLNVVTGAFVDSMHSVSQRDQDLAIERELKKTTSFRIDVTKIFEEADADKSGTISWKEFEHHLQDDRVDAYFKSLELDITEAHALFVLLDVEEDDEVPIERFVEGCLRMRGDAKSIDVNMLLYENEKMLCKVISFTAYAEEQFERIQQALHAGQASRHGKAPAPEPQSVTSNSSHTLREWLTRRQRTLSMPDVLENRETSPTTASSPRGRTSMERRTSVMSAPHTRLDAAISVIALCDRD